ncbi:MAG: DUF642 domain-containing protein [Gammaproteobacteria bacterium]|nr:DUF642 domain-containing protein [Gammaproteobacteria bacterium]
MERNFFKTLLFGGLLSLLWAGSSSANLIVNGGFEETPTAGPITNANWSATQKGYKSSAINGWEGDDMELWCNHSSPTADEGNCFAELNSHYTDEVINDQTWDFYQTFNTVAGQAYDLSFIYSARRDAGDEEFRVTVGDLDITLADHTEGNWLSYSDTFQATSTTTTLMFSSVSPACCAVQYYTYGNFLDNIIVTSSIPEPPILALMGLGLVGLGLARRRRVLKA